MRSIVIRLAVALVIALGLPFPGPHVDYVPIAATLARRDALEASPAFFVIVALALAVYTIVLFGLISLGMAIARRFR